MPIRLLAPLAALLAFASPAAAWWEYGHETVARIAFDSARPETRAELRRLMAKGALLETPDCAVDTPEKLSYWADCIKPLGDRFSYAGPWHYQNVDICKPFDLKAACKDGNCVSAQIERTARLLADKTVPARERLMALAFLVHFVGDLHNPMHAGDRGDRGGNDVKSNYGLVGGRTNLHSMWDGYLAERAISTPPGGASALLASVPPGERAALAAGSVEDWSREQWQASRDHAYTSLLGDPCGPKPETRPTLDEADVQKLIPVLRRGITAGGLRLGRLLDEAMLEGKAPGQRDRDR
ncbi:S1/P1 nuclease [Sphingomonas mesophila]|uniref:S1/P1 nuclease n=1 Tax=Sphingomonas mesophila TaxID=2303576 RepID=UPI000E56AC3C|nr:S1/P1 nuclease [Sphingomonas mesophila]